MCKNIHCFKFLAFKQIGDQFNGQNKCWTLKPPAPVAEGPEFVAVNPETS